MQSTVTALAYKSVNERAWAEHAPGGFLRIVIPQPAKLAFDCLAVGIGAEGGRVVTEMATAAWFKHLRPTAHGPLNIIEMTEPTTRLVFLSVALPRQANDAEVERACMVGRAVASSWAFAVVTASQLDPSALAILGKVYDCIVEGDGGPHHHSYPARTVVEPPSARLICYDLHDVFSLWAGRVGHFGVSDPETDALHIELSDEIEKLAEVDRRIELGASKLLDRRQLAFFNVVAGARPGTTSISFSSNNAVRQHRAASQKKF